ncbi:DUF2007 domain-containing protein [Flavobacteriales bacterium]|jgi:hypothetical protein|nr:DUF2007 domain-containing protein [Flavobacteriales bacterium]
MDWITIHTVTYPSEVYVIKPALENEGFEVFLKDELTVQVDNFISNAIGGIKIQVHQDRAKEAYEFLLNSGLIEESKEHESLLNSITKNIPIVKNWDVISKILFVFFSVFLLLAIFIYFAAPEF